MKKTIKMRRSAQVGTICIILKNVKNTHRRVFLLAKLQASDEACNLNKRNTNPKMFFTFLKNCTNGNKSGKASHMSKEISA